MSLDIGIDGGVNVIERCCRAGLLAVLLLFQTGLASRAGDLAAGSGLFIHSAMVGGAQQELKVYYYRPAAWSPETDRLLFVLHGNARDGEHYRNAWRAQGDRYGVLVVVPQFDRKAFPGPAHYGLGGVVDPTRGVVRPVESWTFTRFDQVVTEVFARTGAKRKSIYLYGHSAGGQFVHRYLTFVRADRVERAVAANAGWYTMPNFEIEFPYGLRGSPAGKSHLRHLFSSRLVILLGEDDTARGESLRKTAEADAQGPHRVARGQAYFSIAAKTASALGMTLAWRLETVPGVGHSNAGMAAAAARVLFE